MLTTTNRCCRLMVLTMSALLAGAAWVVAGGDLRTWADATGRFKIEAKFVSQDKGKVLLEGKDGKRFEIEVTKLSEADQKHVAELAKIPAAVDPFKPVSPAKVVTPDWSNSRQVDLVPTDLNWKVEAKPAPELNVKTVPVGLPARLNFFENCHAFVVNPRCRRALVGYHWSFQNPDGPNSRMLYCDLENGKTLGQFTIDGMATPLAIDDDGGQGLFKRTQGKTDHLEIWSLDAKGCAKVVEFSPTDANGRGHDIRLAAFLDKNRLLTASYGGGLVVLWELPSLKPTYHALIQGNSVPALSHDRKLLAFTTGKQLGILDVDTGKVIAMRTTPHTPFASLAFSSGGNRLACGAHTHLFVWTLATGELHREFTVNPLDVWGYIAWPNEKVMLVGNKSLMDLELGYRFWEYKGHKHVATWGRQAWFVTDGPQGAIIPAEIPSPEVMQAYEKAIPDIVLKPGVVVKIDVSSLPDEAERDTAAKALEDQLVKKGCTVGAGGAIELVASAAVGKEIQIGFVPEGAAGGGRMPFFPKFGPKGMPQPPALPPGTKVRIAKMRGHFARLKLVANGKTVWEASADNIPKSVLLDEGETLDQHLRKLERPNYAFYQTVDLPRLLHRDKGAAPLGESHVSVSGLR